MPSDYHLFLALQNFFKVKRMNNKDEVEKEVSVFASQSESFYTNGIKKIIYKMARSCR